MSKGLQMKYFVLNPTKKDAYGIASREALTMYAMSINRENSDLADDIREWLTRLAKERGGGDG